MLAKESFAALADIDPQINAASAAKTSSYISANKYARIYAVASLGALDSGTETLQLYQATDSSGTSAKVLGASAASATNGARIEVQANTDAMDTAGGFTFVAVRITDSGAGGTGALVSAVMFGIDPDYKA